jgi:uncharacterized DUF497 family protein
MIHKHTHELHYVCDLLFDWDNEKNKNNLVKHGLGFELASYIFHDPFALTQFNRKVENEIREESIGMIKDVVVYVIHTSRIIENKEIIRIISARKANKKEQNQYAKKIKKSVK